MNTSKHYRHELNPCGVWPNIHALDKTEVWTPNVEGELSRMHPGRVVSLRNTPGAGVQLGLACAAMPLFAFRGGYDDDALMTAGSMVGPGMEGQRPQGTAANFVSLVATGGFEVETTEFAEEDIPLFIPNAALTAGLPGTDDAGVLQAGQRYVDTICGIVSNGVITDDAYGHQLLRLWTYFLPPIEDCPEES